MPKDEKDIEYHIQLLFLLASEFARAEVLTYIEKYIHCFFCSKVISMSILCITGLLCICINAYVRFRYSDSLYELIYAEVYTSGHNFFTCWFFLWSATCIETAFLAGMWYFAVQKQNCISFVLPVIIMLAAQQFVLSSFECLWIQSPARYHGRLKSIDQTARDIFISTTIWKVSVYWAFSLLYVPSGRIVSWKKHVVGWTIFVSVIIFSLDVSFLYLWKINV